MNFFFPFFLLVDKFFFFFYLDLENINDKNKLEAIFQTHPHLYEMSIDDPYSLPFIAVEKNFTQIIECYIHRNFDPYELINGKNIYHFAAMKGKLDILRILFA